MNQKSKTIPSSDGLEFIYDRATLESIYLETNFYRDRFPKTLSNYYALCYFILIGTVDFLAIFLWSHFPVTTMFSIFLVLIFLETFLSSISNWMKHLGFYFLITAKIDFFVNKLNFQGTKKYQSTIYPYCASARLINYFNLLVIYIAICINIIILSTYDTEGKEDSLKHKILAVILVLNLIKFFSIIAYIVYLEIKISEYKRNESSNLRHEGNGSELLGVFHKIFFIKQIQKLRFEASFFQKRLPIKLTYLFGAFTVLLSFILIILLSFYKIWYALSEHGIFLALNIFTGLLSGFKSIQGIFILSQINIYEFD
jgi:hypothetical protein